MSELEGRTALVTGGSRGIGRAIVEAFAREGANVAINYHSRQDAADEVASVARACGVRAEVYQADITDFAACERMTQQALADFGTVDMLINNAGIGSASVGRPFVVDAKPEDFRTLLDHHLMGSFHMSKLLVPQMRAAGRGDVVMISSGAATSLTPRMSTYGAAKAAMEALAFVLAKEEREHNIRVNVVAPGLVETDMGEKLMKFNNADFEWSDQLARSPFGMVCQPEDIANAVLFLVSERGRYITNQRLSVNGGGF